ncbi:MAG: hypothetical protein PHS46_08610 [Candidatus Omnitrophica bacterium]|nr:hypothetical protein [Candidatus Omnitrophota bacterium]
MRLGAYILLMFSITVVFYMMGYNSVALNALYAAQSGDTFDIATFLGHLAEGALAPQNAIGTVLALIAGAAATLIAGYAAIYIIPLAFLLMFLNLVVYPFSFVLDPAMPDMIKVPLVVFFNLLSIMAVLSFIRGGNV